MQKTELYRLPAFGRAGFRTIFVRAAGLYLLALCLLAWFFTQQIAHRLGYPQALGEPWVTVPGNLSRVFLILGLLAGAARVGVFGDRKAQDVGDSSCLPVVHDGGS